MNQLQTNLRLMPGRMVVPPTVEAMLDEFGPLPHEALVFGMCEDGQPVLVNLMDTSEPLFVCTPERLGKTHLLKAAAAFGRSTLGSALRTAVLTDRTDEWMHVRGVEVFEINAETLGYYLMNVGKVSASMGNHSFGLILIDGWESVLEQMDGEPFLQRMREHSLRVCTVITSRQTVEYTGVKRLDGDKFGRFLFKDHQGEIHRLFVPSL